MSLRNTQSNNIAGSTLSQNTLALPESPRWVRNPAWPTLELPSSAEQKIVGLYAAWPNDSNLFAISCAGAYNVVRGDGTSVNVASGSTTQYTYDFNNTNLYDATVTLTDSGNLISRTSHGYTDGSSVIFYRITGTSGLAEGQKYFVINSTANTFQVAATQGGIAVDLVTDGSASLLPYKIATVVITPQAGQNLTSFSAQVGHSQKSFYSSGWLQLGIAGSNITTLSIGSSSASTMSHRSLEQIDIIQLGSISNLSSLLYNCSSLLSANINLPSSTTILTQIFGECKSLATAPLFNTANVTDMSFMFTGCRNLDTVPLYDTASVTTMENMFASCHSLETVPLFNTANVTNMSSMFSFCFSLTTVPLLNTSSVQFAASMFADCRRLKRVPAFNFASLTTGSAMFSSCFSLEQVPLFNTTSALTNTSSMFLNCTSLEDGEAFNTSSVTNMNSMFSGCVALRAVPLFNTQSVTSMSSMFLNCNSLNTIPPFNLSQATTLSNAFEGCTSLNQIPSISISPTGGPVGSAFLNCPSLSALRLTPIASGFSISSCKFSTAALLEVFENTKDNTLGTLTVTGNFGVGTSVTLRSTTTTAQSVTATIANTASLANGMLVTGTGTGITTGITVTSDTAANTLTLSNHGLPDDTPVSFSAIGTTTGVSVGTIYYVVTSTTNTFQVAATVGGAALDLTGTNSSAVNVRYANYITNIVTNVSITLSTPMATSGTNNLNYRTLDAAKALLRLWSVTF